VPEHVNNYWEWFAAAAERYPGATAIQVQRAEKGGAPGQLDAYSYGGLRRMAEVTAGGLVAREIEAGDRVAILSDNDAHWCAAFLGITRLGAIAVPLDTNYKAKQVATVLRDSGAKLLFTIPKYLPTAEEATRAAGLSPEEIILLHNDPQTPAAVLEQYANLDEVFRAGAPAPELPACPARRASTCVILYTSGTTSDPKGVVLTHANVMAEIEAIIPVVNFCHTDAILGILPLFHALALLANLWAPLVVGARVVYLEALNTTELLRALRERDITVFACVPQFFYLIHQRVTEQVASAGWAKRKAFRALLRLNGGLRRGLGINLGRLFFRKVHAVLGLKMRFLVTGGSRFEPKIGFDYFQMGFDILQGYGLTECAGAATATRPGETRVDSVGQALPGIEVKTLPPEPGSECPDGEVLIRGPIVMPGYYNRPEVNAQVLRDGWLYTGDLGYLDSKGRLFITGRKKEMIVLSSGKNIYPEEIEAHYLQSPYIKEICVMGVSRPNEPAAERLHAVVVPDMDVMRQRKVVNTNEWMRYDIETLSVQLPSHKRVLSYEVWNEELPRTTTKKLRRFEIERRVRERAAQQAAEAASASPAAKPMTEEDIVWAADPVAARALAVITEAAKNKQNVRPDANIELDLGMDSMERVELLTHLEQMFGTEVPDEVAQKIYTVRELVEAVRPQGEGGAAAGAGGDVWAKLLADAPDDDPVLRELLRPRLHVALVMFTALRLCYAAAWLLLGFRVRGREHLPKDAPFLLCPNHQSYLDAFLLVSALPFRVFRKLFFVGASEYFATPVMRWIAKQINVVPVDPDTNLLRAMQAGAFGLRHHRVLILFPEGERSIDGTVKKFKKGAAILSLNLEAPVVPVAMDGVHEVWPRGRGLNWGAFLPGSGARMLLAFGAPLAPSAKLPAGASLSQAEARYAGATEQLRSAVAALWDHLHAEMTRG
jgi:long-chain acyl-CoA synthetase